MSAMTIQIALENIDELRAAVKDTNFKLWARMTTFRHRVEANALSTQDMHIVFAKFNTAVEKYLTA